MSQAINFWTNFLGERQEEESCFMFPFPADSGTCQASVILQAQAVMLHRDTNWALGSDP